jgi:predicted secreted protein
MLPKRYRRLIARRFRRRPLLGPLLAATFVLDLVILFADPPQPGGPPHALALGFVCAQLALLGAWLASSRRGVASRLTASLGLGSLMAVMLAERGNHSYPAMLTFAMLALFASATTCAVTRLALRWLASQGWPAGSVASSPARYSIATLFAATTAAAMLVTVARWFDWGLLREPAAVSAIAMEALIPAIGIAATAPRNCRWRLSAVAIATAGMGLVVLTLSTRLGGSPSSHLALYASQWLTCVTWLLGLGVRPRRQPKNAVVLRIASPDAERSAAESAERLEARRTLFIALGFDARV